jgi:endonuclease/exonuclease/phosphatase family metal-dependent hydrolase
MKIYSWNMLFRNQKLDDALRWIETLEFDVICLQEVPEAFLEKLRSLPWHLAHTIEAIRHEPNGDRNIYSVVLSKHPITAQGTIRLPEVPPSARVSMFIRLMRPLHFVHVSDHEAVYADITLPNHSEPLRVVSAHISLTHPTQRALELEAIFEHLTPRTIVCGDFNIIESWRVSLLNFLLGGTIRDATHYSTERIRVEEMFGNRSLVNPLRDQITHPFGLSQLDHILVPNTMPIRRCGIYVHAHGSDHRPIFAFIDL